MADTEIINITGSIEPEMIARLEARGAVIIKTTNGCLIMGISRLVFENITGTPVNPIRREL